MGCDDAPSLDGRHRKSLMPFDYASVMIVGIVAHNTLNMAVWIIDDFHLWRRRHGRKPVGPGRPSTRPATEKFRGRVPKRHVIAGGVEFIIKQLVVNVMDN